MDVSWILFDIDNTLLDFDSSSKLALQASFRHFELPFNEDNYKTYKRINANIWHEFEKGQITALKLRHKRFDLLFEALKLFPTTGHEFNAYYLNQLIEQSIAYDKVPDMLIKLKKKYKISVITNGLREVQRSRLNHLKIAHHFDSIIVSDEIGVAKPDKAYFDHVFTTIENSPRPNKTLVVGDNIHSDIKGGTDYGCRTCWIKNNNENTGDLNPDYIIQHINEFDTIIDYNQF